MCSDYPILPWFCLWPGSLIILLGGLSKRRNPIGPRYHASRGSWATQLKSWEFLNPINYAYWLYGIWVTHLQHIYIITFTKMHIQILHLVDGHFFFFKMVRKHIWYLMKEGYIGGKWIVNIIQYYWINLAYV